MNLILIRISIRRLLKNKFASLVSILGLSVGFVAFILIALFIRYELSWDKANENYDRIYLVQRNISLSSMNTGGDDISPVTPAMTASLLRDFSGVETTAVAVETNGRFLSVSPTEQLRIESGIYAGNDYLEMFTYRFTGSFHAGEFNEPYTVLLSESLANRLFGSSDALGQVISIDRKTDLKVTGIYADLPLNTSIRPDYIISFATLERELELSPQGPGPAIALTFVMLKEGAVAETLGAGIEGVFSRFEGMEAEKLVLSPLSLLRIESVPDYYNIVWLFGLIGLFILSMSSFNYINLSMANSSMRGKEIAIKKMSGGKRPRLIIQFLGETMLLSVFAVALSFYMVSLVLPLYNNMMNTAISLDFISDGIFLAVLVVGSLLIGLLAGVYPAFFMSSSSIVSLFKGDFKQGNEKLTMRKILVLMQFAISVFLIGLSLFFLKHVEHISGKDIGFNREELIYVRLSSTEGERYFDDFGNRLLSDPSIVGASMSDNLPFVNFSGGRINREGADPDELVFYRPNRVTRDFVSNMGMQLVAGRDFSHDFSSDVDRACIINETAARYFGWDDPIGMRLDNNRYTVIGVVKDYHIMDVHNPIDPVVLILDDGEMTGDRVFAFRHASGLRDDAESLLAGEFTREFPDDPFEMGLLESAFVAEDAYRSYQTLKRSVMLFTAFNILLAVTGLLGLVSFSVARRTKEIGIRKINGSSVTGIFLLLNREFLVLLVVSIALAWPGIWLVWNAFPGVHKSPLHPAILLASALIIIVITLLSTGWQTWKAARRNPVEALRNE